MQTVRADHQVGGPDGPVAGGHPCGCAGRDGVHLVQKADLNSCLARPAGQDLDHVGAVNAQVRLIGRMSCKIKAQHRRPVRVPQADRLGAHRSGGGHRGVQAKAAQNRHAVGRDLDAGADLAHRLGLFQHGDLGTAQGQGPRRSQAPDPRTHDNNLELIQIHVRSRHENAPERKPGARGILTFSQEFSAAPSSIPRAPRLNRRDALSRGARGVPAPRGSWSRSGGRPAA